MVTAVLARFTRGGVGLRITVMIVSVHYVQAREEQEVPAIKTGVSAPFAAASLGLPLGQLSSLGTENGTGSVSFVIM